MTNIFAVRIFLIECLTNIFVFRSKRVKNSIPYRNLKELQPATNTTEKKFRKMKKLDQKKLNR